MQLVTEPGLQRDVDLHRLLRLLQHVHSPREPRSLVRAAFDVNMSAHVRQSMPLPPIKCPSRVEAWAECRRIVEDLVLLNDLSGLTDPAMWQVSEQHIECELTSS